MKNGRLYGRIALLMAGIVAVSAGITALTATVGGRRERYTVVTTVYPLYVAAQNVIGDESGVTLENLTGAATGCLHDYQLSPANRISLQRADLLLLNGAGAEAFLADILPTLPRLTTVDTGAGLNTLAGHHEHEHEHEEHEHEEQNEHLWVSPRRYAGQIAAVTDALCALDPARAAAYRRNGDAYRARVEAVADELAALRQTLAGTPCVLFHDSLAYLADDLGLLPVASLTVGEESGVSAADLAEAVSAVREHPDALVLYDDQYAVRYTAVDSQAARERVLALDCAVLGHGHADDWLTAMEKNLTLLKGVTR